MTFKNAAVALAFTIPAWAQALDLREPPLQTMTLEPGGSQESADARQAHRLRDTLRQAPGDRGADGKPFRLSAEERQRLREQLRSQAVPSVRDR